MWYHQLTKTAFNPVHSAMNGMWLDIAQKSVEGEDARIQADHALGAQRRADARGRFYRRHWFPSMAGGGLAYLTRNINRGPHNDTNRNTLVDYGTGHSLMRAFMAPHMKEWEQVPTNREYLTRKPVIKMPTFNPKTPIPPATLKQPKTMGWARPSFAKGRALRGAWMLPAVGLQALNQWLSNR